MDPADEARLVAGLRARDPRAWYEFYETLVPRMISYAKRRLRRYADYAEDVVQEISAQLLEEFTFRGDSEFEAFLFSIVRNKCNNLVRNMNKHQEILRKISKIKWRHNLTPEDRERIRGRILSAVDKLERDLRKIMLIFWNSDGDYKEISKLLGISESAARGRIFRAHRKVADLFGVESFREAIDDLS